jgi:hypothetical protein
VAEYSTPGLKDNYSKITLTSLPAYVLANLKSAAN